MTRVFKWGTDEEETGPYRISTRVADMLVPPVPDAVIDECSRCQKPVYFSMDQKVPPEVEGAQLVCSRCLLSSPDLAVNVPEAVARVFRDLHGMADRGETLPLGLRRKS